MAEKMCNTINQNIEPQTERKLLNNYSKQIGTLLNTFNALDKNNLANTSISGYLDSIADYEISKKLETRQTQNKVDKTPCFKRLETTGSNIESFMKTLPKIKNSVKNLNQICPPFDDTLSDVDMENFDPNNRQSIGSKLSNCSAACDKTETLSLSNFHNVSDALVFFSNRLESYLKTNTEENVDDCKSINRSCLKENISELKRELERYVDIINAKKENELRKFSENMMRHSKILHMQNAFSRQEKLKTNIYETLESSHFKYAIADNESLQNSFRFFRDRSQAQAGYPLQSCLSDSSIYSDCSSVECYTMLINEERAEHLLNDAPIPRYYGRENISLIFRDPSSKHCQSFQNRKAEKSLQSLWSKRHSIWARDSESFWGFTLDSHKNEILELKLHEERRMRLFLRVLFGFLSIATFVLIVFFVESMFSFKKRETFN